MNGNFCGTITTNNTGPWNPRPYVYWYPWYPYDTGTTGVDTKTNTIPHVHDFRYSRKDAYGDISTCKTCGEVKRTPTQLGATWTITTSQ